MHPAFVCCAAGDGCANFAATEPESAPVAATEPVPLKAIEPVPLTEPAPLASVYRFHSLNVVDLPAELVRPFMVPLSSNTQAALRRVIDGGSPVFSHALLDAPARPGSYATTHTAITRRLRTVTRNPDARLFGWRGDGTWAMSKATFDALKHYFDSNAK